MVSHIWCVSHLIPLHLWLSPLCLVLWLVGQAMAFQPPLSAGGPPPGAGGEFYNPPGQVQTSNDARVGASEASAGASDGSRQTFG